MAVNLEEYFRTTFEDKLLVWVFKSLSELFLEVGPHDTKLNNFHFTILIFPSKMPEREDDHLTPATRLLEKRREMSEVEQALAAQKEACCLIYKLF